MNRFQFGVLTGGFCRFSSSNLESLIYSHTHTSYSRLIGHVKTLFRIKSRVEL